MAGYQPNPGLDCQKSDSWMAKVVIFMSYFDFENGSRFAY
jgi:hypothetical protein